MDLYNASMGDEEAPEEMELTLEQYEEAKAHYQGIIDRGDAAKRLAENPDFQELVMKGYFKNEPARLADLMASGKLPEAVFIRCTDDIKAVGAFRNFMKLHTDQAQMARDEMESLEEARDEAIRLEEEAAARD